MLFLHSFFVCLSICLVVDSSVVFLRDCSCISCVGAFKSQIHIQQVFHSFWPGQYTTVLTQIQSFLFSFFLFAFCLCLFLYIAEGAGCWLLVAGCWLPNKTNYGVERAGCSRKKREFCELYNSCHWSCQFGTSNNLSIQCI